jgi:hypothetical protein
LGKTGFRQAQEGCRENDGNQFAFHSSAKRCRSLLGLFFEHSRVTSKIRPAVNKQFAVLNETIRSNKWNQFT